MNHPRTRNSILALIGLAALAIYILACTSFSPDDTKVLYPAFDPASGQVGVWMYDRESRRSEAVFQPMWSDSDGDPLPQRPQWLPDGRGVLVAWSGQDDDRLFLATVPVGVRGPVRVFALPEIDEAASVLMRPLPVVGSRVFVSAGDGVLRLDLVTGEIKAQEHKGEIVLFPSGAGKQLVYLEQAEGESSQVVLGRMNPDSFAKTPVMTITNQLDDGHVLPSPDGRRLVLVETKLGAARLEVLRDGKTEFTRPLELNNEKVSLGLLLLAPAGDVVYAPFLSRAEDKSSSSYGFLEIPLNRQPIRRTLLIRDVAGKADSEAALYFQAALSHDGKTLALASTYLACLNDPSKFPAADCALFLVDLGDPGRKVTRVPIPIPGGRRPAGDTK